MRLDFNVLWIDDQPKYVLSNQETLRMHIYEEGFKLNVIQVESFEKATNFLADDIFVDNIDLVVVDYNLGENEHGDVAIRKIRSRVRYKDIIFYSAASTAILMELVKGVEGIYCANRPELSDTLIGVFDTLVKKVLDIDHCRGIVMGVTSDIDQIVSDSLLMVEKLLIQDHKDVTSEYVLKNLDKRIQRLNTVRDRLVDGMPMIDMLRNYEAVPTADKLKLLKKVLDLHFPESHAEIRSAVGYYLEEVPKERNILGHARLVAKDTKRILRVSGNKEITAETLKVLRKKLIDYRDNFEELANIVGLPLDQVLDEIESSDGDST